MVDIKKVMKGLQCLARTKEPTSNPCADCGYIDRPNFAICVVDIAADALELLKEQESKPVLYRDDGEYCPWCSTVSTRTMGVQRLHRGTRYCPYCGQAVKWE